MAGVVIPYLREKRDARGQLVGYYWQPGKHVRALGFYPEALGKDAAKAIKRAAELNADVDATREKRQDTPASVTGTFRHLVAKYRGGLGHDPSQEWNELADKSRDDYGRYLNIIEEKWGPFPVRALDTELVRDLKDEYRDRPYAGNYLLRVLSSLISFALQYKRSFGLSHNPCADVPKFGKKAGVKARRQYWTEADEAAFLSRAESQDIQVAVGYFLLSFTGQRPEDVLAMDERDYDGVKILVVQQKTGAHVWIPCHSDLRARLDRHLAERRASGRVGGKLLQTNNGGQFSKRYFYTRWDAVVAAVQAGHLATSMQGDQLLAAAWAAFSAGTDGAVIADGLVGDDRWLAVVEATGASAGWDAAVEALPIADLQRRDLRRTAVIRLSEAGCEVQEIAAITGHSPKSAEQIISSVYWVRTYAQAENAIAKLEDHHRRKREAQPKVD